MRVVGITGGIGSGKSAVLAGLERRGARVLDADRIGWEVMRRGEPAHALLVSRFGEEILAAGGEIDRKALASRVFGNPRAVPDLNAILHPAILDALASRIEEARRDGVAVVAVEAALIVEAGARDRFDLLVSVLAPREARIQRLLARGSLTREDVLRRMAAQAPDEKLREAGDLVLENDGDLEALERKIDRLWQEIQGAKENTRRPTG